MSPSDYLVSCQDTRCESIMPLREAVGVIYSPSRLGHSNEGVLCILQSSSITGVDIRLLSFISGHSLELGVFPSAEMQPVYVSVIYQDLKKDNHHAW